MFFHCFLLIFIAKIEGNQSTKHQKRFVFFKKNVFIVLNTYACGSLSTIIQRPGIVPRVNRTWRRVPLVPRTAGKQFYASCSIHSTFVCSAVNHYSRFELLNAAMPERFATITIAANANTSVSLVIVLNVL